MKRLCLILLFSLGTLSATAGLFIVGNAGEGVWDGGRLFTRDLYVYNRHLHPWVGTEVDADVSADLQSWTGLPLTDEARQILARKLSDMERSHPGLGRKLILALRFFEWTLTQEPMALAPEEGGRTHLPEERRAALANRYLESILIYAPDFKKLDATHQVALILHEIIYALARVEKVRDVPQFENAETVRLLTAGLFSETQLFSAGFKNQLLRVLDINGLSKGLEPVYAADKRNIYLAVAGEGRYAPPQTPGLMISEPGNNSVLAPSVTEYCQALKDEKSFPLNVNIYQSPVWVVNSRLYRNENLTEQLQIRIDSEGSIFPRVINIESFAICSAALINEIKNISSR